MSRALVARRLVGFVSWLWDHSYASYEDGVRWRERIYSTAARWLSRPFLRTALRLDREEAVEAMVEGGWWG